MKKTELGKLLKRRYEAEEEAKKAIKRAISTLSRDEVSDAHRLCELQEAHDALTLKANLSDAVFIATDAIQTGDIMKAMRRVALWNPAFSEGLRRDITFAIEEGIAEKNARK